MSFVRFLLYSNEIDVEGLVAGDLKLAEGHHASGNDAPDDRALMDRCSRISSSTLRVGPRQPNWMKKLVAGNLAYGMAAVGARKSSPGSQLLIKAADRDDPRPWWVTIWGGANTLAQALTGCSSDVCAGRVSEIRGQAPRVLDFRSGRRRTLDPQGIPQAIYVVRPSPPNGEEYYYATWTGISGDLYYRNGAGADFSTVTNEWLDANIRSKGPLGRQYPKFAFIMEGDTPSRIRRTDR